MKKCPKCSMQVKDTAKFCVYCGFNIKKHEEEYTSPRHFCPECGAEITEGSFCPECGASISEHLGDSKLGGILSDFDFSGLENEAHKQLIEQIGLEIEGSVLVKYTGKSRTVEIPKGITEIFDGAFMDNKIISEVIIPEGVTVIGKNAFKGCAYLKSVNIPSTVKEIYEDAFNCCSELEEIDISCETEQIRYGVFNYCRKLEKITLSPSITAINDSFKECSRLTDIYISDLGSWCNIDGLNYLMQNKLENRIFVNNRLLTSVLLPNSVTKISNFAFYNCTEISALSLPSSVEHIGRSAFCGCKKLASIELPEALNFIGTSAFSGCGIAEINIPAGVTMEAAIFADCVNLVKATVSSDIPASSSCDGKYSVFSGCKNLQNVIITNGVKSIGACAFSGLSSLTQISIPDSVVSIGAYAFNGCSGLKNITIPSSVDAIGQNTFAGCSGLTSVIIPDSVNTIEAAAFFNCSNLESITLPFVGKSRNASGCEGVLGYIFGYTVVSTNPGNGYTDQYEEVKKGYGYTEYKHYYYNIPKSLRSVTITDATHIGAFAFKNCINLTEINILSSVETIGSSAFYFCRGISKIKLPKTVKKICAGAFTYCSELSRINIPDGVTHIENGIFSNCPKITKLNIPASVISISGGIASESVTEIEVSPNNTVYTSLKGNLYSKDMTTLYCYAPGKTDTTFHLPYSVKTIGSYAFNGCSHLKNLYLYTADDLETISSYAFSNCNALICLTVPESVKYIGKNAFYYCKALEIMVPKRFGRYTTHEWNDTTEYREQGCRVWTSY